MFAQNDKYILKALCEEDKANYLMLYRENSIVAKTSSKMSDVDYDEFAEFVWEKLPEDDAIYVSVFLKDDNLYVGNITMQHLASDTPEIGMDVLLKYRRQRIAYEIIPLFAKRVLELILTRNPEAEKIANEIHSTVQISSKMTHLVCPQCGQLCYYNYCHDIHCHFFYVFSDTS